MQVERYDRGQIVLNQPVIDPISGFVTADAFATRTGVFTYRKRDGSVTKELRHPDDVFAPDSLETLKRVSVTDEHPARGAVTIDTARYQTVGHTGDVVERADDKVRVPITLIDKKIINKMRPRSDGRPPKKELSCGYLCKVVKDSGEYNGERYDHRQTNIRYNHIAVVTQGRAGKEVRARMDADDAVADDLAELWYFDKANDADPKPEQTMKFKKDAIAIGDYKVDAFEIEVPDEASQSADALFGRLDGAHSHITDLTGRLDTVTGERDAQKTEIETLKTKLDEAKKGPSMEVVRDMAQAYAEVSGVARHLKIVTKDEMSVAEIKRSIVASKNEKLKEDASEEYIAGQYGMILDSLKDEIKAQDSLAELGVITSDKGDDSPKHPNPTGPGKSARDRFIEKQASASKTEAK